MKQSAYEDDPDAYFTIELTLSQAVIQIRRKKIMHVEKFKKLQGKSKDQKEGLIVKKRETK